jgi:predicted solute-binding protein
MADLRVLINPYLNAAPLWWSLRRQPPPGWTIEDALPAAATRALGAGECDLALVSAAALPALRGVRVLRDWGVAADGPVDTVVLVLKTPLAQVRTLGVDSASRSAQQLLRLLCVSRFLIAPQFVPVSDPAQALLELDAVLAIGDKAFKLGKGLPRLDLAQEWRDWTGLPFIFAVWAAREAAAGPETAALLEQAARAGIAESAAIAAHFAASLKLPPARLESYLHSCVHHRLGETEWRGFQRFVEACVAAGLIRGEEAREPVFF